MPYHENSRKTFIAAGPIPQDCLVKLTAAGLEVCGEGEVPVGVTEVGARVAGEHVGVRLLNTPGTLEVACGATVTLGQLLSSGEAGAVAPHSGQRAAGGHGPAGGRQRRSGGNHARVQPDSRNRPRRITPAGRGQPRSASAAATALGGKRERVSARTADRASSHIKGA